MKEERNVLGRPVHGEIMHYSHRNLSEQYDAARFIEELDKVFENEKITAIRWYQYTPYFNDGEACVFGISELSLKLKDEEDFIDTYELTDWDAKNHCVVDNPKYVDVNKSLKNMSDFGHYETFLYENFGDPAEVVATREGFEVEFYDHD